MVSASIKIVITVLLTFSFIMPGIVLGQQDYDEVTIELCIGRSVLQLSQPLLKDIDYLQPSDVFDFIKVRSDISIDKELFPGLHRRIESLFYRLYSK